MPSAIELSCDTFRCEIASDLGRSIAGLWRGERPVLRSTPAQAVPSSRPAGEGPLASLSRRGGRTP